MITSNRLADFLLGPVERCLVCGYELGRHQGWALRSLQDLHYDYSHRGRVESDLKPYDSLDTIEKTCKTSNKPFSGAEEEKKAVAKKTIFGYDNAYVDEDGAMVYILGGPIDSNLVTISISGDGEEPFSCAYAPMTLILNTLEKIADGEGGELKESLDYFCRKRFFDINQDPAASFNHRLYPVPENATIEKDVPSAIVFDGGHTCIYPEGIGWKVKQNSEDCTYYTLSPYVQPKSEKERLTELLSNGSEPDIADALAALGVTAKQIEENLS